MQGIENTLKLEKILGVEIGDLIMCTYEPPFVPKGTCLDIAFGLYDPFQGIKGGAMGPGYVDLMHEAHQREDLVRSEEYFRVHLIGHGFGKKSELYNVDGAQTQIPVKNVMGFKVVLKAKDVTKFYKKSAKV